MTVGAGARPGSGLRDPGARARALSQSAQGQYDTVYTDLAWWRAHGPRWCVLNEGKNGVHVDRVGVEQWLRCDEEALAVDLARTLGG